MLFHELGEDGVLALELGFEAFDSLLVGVFDGGPTGVEAMAATMNLPTDTLSDEVEPYLLREQFIVRSPRGRAAWPFSKNSLSQP